MASSPPKTAKNTSQKSTNSSPLTKLYLFIYNLVSLGLWASITFHLFQFLLTYFGLLQHQQGDSNNVIQFFNSTFPLLKLTQSLAILEILHSLIRLVRASVFTTAMQVASRLLLVWGVMFVFSSFGEECEHLSAAFDGKREYILGSRGGVSTDGNEAGILSHWAFVGCVCAWGVTECIRYGFFVLQIAGLGVPSWMLWLRYNTFFVLYPLGISCECLLVYLAATSGDSLNPLISLAFKVILGIYIPGSYILYTHMMAQRRKVMRAAAAKRAE